jgi:hypothetical protein
VVVTTSISERLPLSPDTPPRVKRLVSSPPEELVFSVVPRRSRIKRDDEGVSFAWDSLACICVSYGMNYRSEGQKIFHKLNMLGAMLDEHSDMGIV